MKKFFGAMMAGLVALLICSVPASAEVIEWDLAPNGARVEMQGPTPGLRVSKSIPGSGNQRKSSLGTSSLLSSSYYLYNVGSQAYAAKGVSANSTIGCQSGSLNTATDYHTLGEITVEGGTGQVNIVELGWTCDPAVNGGSSAPHLFMGYWVNGVFQGYNGGAHFTRVTGACDLIGTAVPTGGQTAPKFAIQQWNGAWWLFYNTCWLGKVDNAAWTGVGGFTTTNYIQAFGELAGSEAKPCSDIGTGYPGTNTTSPNYAARFSSVLFLRENGDPLGDYPTTDVNLSVRPVPTIEAGSPYYVVNKVSGRSFWYGGPGYNSAGTAVGTRLAC